jgi:Protein of unknown function (DUF2569)
MLGMLGGMVQLGIGLAGSTNQIDTAYDITLMGLWAGAIILFFKEKRQFPKVWFWILLATGLFHAGLSVLATNNGYVLDANDIKAVMQPFMAIIIWGPHFLLSRRVKATFVN